VTMMIIISQKMIININHVSRSRINTEASLLAPIPYFIAWNLHAGVAGFTYAFTNPKLIVICDLKLCSLAEICRCFGGTYSFRNVGKLLPDYSMTAVRTSNLA
jgi:hypothetical protein